MSIEQISIRSFASRRRPLSTFLDEFQIVVDRFSGLKSNPGAWLRNKMEGWNAEDYFFGDKLDLPATSAASRRCKQCILQTNHCSIGYIP